MKLSLSIVLSTLFAFNAYALQDYINDESRIAIHERCSNAAVEMISSTLMYQQDHMNSVLENENCSINYRDYALAIRGKRNELRELAYERHDNVRSRYRAETAIQFITDLINDRPTHFIGLNNLNFEEGRAIFLAYMSNNEATFDCRITKTKFAITEVTLGNFSRWDITRSGRQNDSCPITRQRYNTYVEEYQSYNYHAYTGVTFSEWKDFLDDSQESNMAILNELLLKRQTEYEQLSDSIDSADISKSRIESEIEELQAGMESLSRDPRDLNQ